MSSQIHRYVTLLWTGVLIAGVALRAGAADAQEPADRETPATALTELSLESLMNIEVTSVSKRKETRREAAAAIFVLTQEDIRRSGATTLAEALRLVPGLSVARLDANKWAISSRGFNDRFANKLLVLVDGRSAYTPLTAGVYWETLDMLLEDIERIEVIRGPGGTLWGANAVNGVINIITKNARDTQGGLVTGGAGTEERAFGGFRYGSKLSESTAYRVYAKYFDRGAGAIPPGGDAADSWNMGRVGFRIDSNITDRDMLMVQGVIYDGDEGATFVHDFPYPPYSRQTSGHTDDSGGNALVRWNHVFSESADSTLQLYYDQCCSRWFHDGVVMGYDIETLDMDLQHHFAIGARHDVVCGVGFRDTEHAARNTFDITYTRRTRSDQLFSGFIQDEISLAGDRLRLALGSKLEHNDYTGLEIQPSARVAWVPNERHMWWAAVSRAVRTPSRAESDIRLNPYSFPFVLVSQFGNPEMKAESLLAYEAGYRFNVSDRLSLDLTGFYNVYDDLRTIEAGMPFPEFFPLLPHLVIPMSGDNNMKAETFGVESAAEWAPAPWWRLRATYAFLDVNVRLSAKTLDLISGSTEGDSPQHQFGLFSRMDLGKNVELDAVARYVDSLPSLGVDSYTSLDLRLGWRPKENLEIALVGQNLLDAHHQEFVPSFQATVPVETERGVYAKATWRF